MNKFHKNIKKNPSLDNEIIAALSRNQLAFDEGRIPDYDDLKLVHDTCWDFVIGKDNVFKMTEKKNGRPAKSGFTTDDIISAFIELKRRELESINDKKPFVNAKKIACEIFDSFSQPAEARRKIDKHWQIGGETASILSDEDLQEIIKPYF